MCYVLLDFSILLEPCMPRWTTVAMSRTFSVIGPSLWNCLPGFRLQLVSLSYHPIRLYNFLKLVYFLGANQTKSASVCPRLLRALYKYSNTIQYITIQYNGDIVEYCCLFLITKSSIRCPAFCCLYSCLLSMLPCRSSFRLLSNITRYIFFQVNVMLPGASGPTSTCL